MDDKLLGCQCSILILSGLAAYLYCRLNRVVAVVDHNAHALDACRKALMDLCVKRIARKVADDE